MRAARPVVVIAVLAAGWSMPVTPPALAASARIICRDGNPLAVVRRGHTEDTLPFCNHDQPGDGVCTFAICDPCPLIRGCVGPGSGVCADPPAPPGMLVVVPVRHTRAVRIGAARIVFRCRPPAATTTTSTTTLQPRPCGPDAATGQCGGDCPRGSSCQPPPPDSGLPVACICRSTGTGCQSDGDCDDGNPCTYDSCVGGTCQHECLCVGPGGTFTCCPGPAAQCGGLTWFYTCGDPVCGVHRDHPGVPPCTPDQRPGAACSPEGASCDPGDGCNRLLVCARSDPTHGGVCPISRRRDKEDVRYLSDTELERLHDELMRFRLATYRYRAPEAGARRHLGFVIDDVEPSMSVDADRDIVDLYGYASMAVAALQTQARQIEELKREVKMLRAHLGDRDAAPIAR